MHRMKADEDRKMEEECAPFPTYNDVPMTDEIGHHSCSNGTELVAPLSVIGLKTM